MMSNQTPTLLLAVLTLALSTTAIKAMAATSKAIGVIKPGPSQTAQNSGGCTCPYCMATRQQQL